MNNSSITRGRLIQPADGSQLPSYRILADPVWELTLVSPGDLPFIHSRFNRICDVWLRGGRLPLKNTAVTSGPEAQREFETSFIHGPLLLLALGALASQRPTCHARRSKVVAHWSTRCGFVDATNHIPRYWANPHRQHARHWSVIYHKGKCLSVIHWNKIKHQSNYWDYIDKIENSLVTFAIILKISFQTYQTCVKHSTKYRY